MCGFAGAVSCLGAPVDIEALQAGACLVKHRGPNDGQQWQSENRQAAFIHHRLSILDLSPGGAQPMQHGTYVMVYNGEIYNYLELKKELQQKGYTFQSSSDTEVLLKGYEAYGHGVLKKLDGAFAFAIWDTATQCLFAARDRFGEKPFFFCTDGGQFRFASEMKALWSAGVAKNVNEALLYNYLTIGYTGNPADGKETFYNNILKLPAASFLTISAPDFTINIERYWTLEYNEGNAITEAAALEQFDFLLRDSVRKRLRSDVAIGTSLSGGLDSGSIVALCAEEKGSAYAHKGITATFPNFARSEEAHAAQVAKQFGLQHFQISIRETDALACMDAVAYHQEEPFTSASTIAQFLVYKKAREAGVSVLLDGQGADEILAGYSKYYFWYWQQLYRQKRLKKSGEWAAAQTHGVLKKFGLAQKAAALLPQFASAMHQTVQSRKAAANAYLNRDFAASQKRNFYYSLPHQPTLNAALYYNTAVNGLEELLRYADRNSMAHGVEVRLPFLQHQLVEFLFSLPPHFKIRNGFTKWLLRKSMHARLPESIVWQKDKIGFEPPQKSWMQHKAIGEKLREGIDILTAQGILSAKAKAQFVPTDAFAANAFYWRFWSASVLWKKDELSSPLETKQP